MNLAKHDAERAELMLEREARAAAYLAALAERDALAANADRPGADAFDKRVLALAETRLGRARWSCEFWGEPVPGAAEIIKFPSAAAPEGFCSLSLAAGAADHVEATAARILASDTVPGEGHEDAEVDAIARRIAAA